MGEFGASDAPIRLHPGLAQEPGLALALADQGEVAQAEVEAQMQEVVRFALDSPWPSPDEITEDIFA